MTSPFFTAWQGQWLQNLTAVFVQSKWLLQLELIYVNKQDEAQYRATVWWLYTSSQLTHLSCFCLGVNAYLKSLKVLRKRFDSKSGRLALWLDDPVTRGSLSLAPKQSFFFVYLVESLLEDTERLPAHTAESSDINKKQGKAINITKLGIHIKDDPKSIIEAH